MELLTYTWAGAQLVFQRDDEKISLVGLFPSSARQTDQESGGSLSQTQCFEGLHSNSVAQVQQTGEDRPCHHGVRSIGSYPGDRLKLVDINDVETTVGRLLTLTLRDPTGPLILQTNYHLINGVPIVRCWSTVINSGDKPVGLEWVYSAAFYNLATSGLKPWWEKTLIHVGHNTWCGEGQWRKYRPEELGLVKANRFSHCAAQVSNLGSWSSHKALPMGMLEDTETGVTWFWQIEHSGSWHWEVAEDNKAHLYMLAGGPDALRAGWWKQLTPGESFTTVPVAVGVVEGSFTEGVAALTSYRRSVLLKCHPADQKLPVIFNDYMNCLSGNPTTEKLLPLIDAAARAGAEYFVIDAGWYADIQERWWSTVGAWEPSASRFPGGLAEPMQAIRDKGMVPGLWLEIEVVGVHSPMAAKPDAWFMQRHGQRVVDNGRYFLDFRNPDVQAHATAVVDRLVRDFQIGYIKMDYNVNATLGTDNGADSPADGLLVHTRAYCQWLDYIHTKYPELVIENCSSGGNRIDYNMLAHTELLSSSDQVDYRLYPSILSGVAAACLPEQLAVWSYPMRGRDAEEAAFNMANALLLRIHQSGHLAELAEEQFGIVQEGIAVYKSIRGDIKRAVPFWPFGFIPMREQNTWYAFGTRIERVNRAYLVVWRLASPDPTTTVPLSFLKGKDAQVELLFPKKLPVEYQWHKTAGQLVVKQPISYSARVFRIEWSQ